MFHKPPSTQSDDDHGSLETNLDGIASQVCAQPPGSPCSIQLVMDHEIDPEAEFMIIRDFTMACLRVLWGRNATPCDLTSDNLDLLSRYVKSIGYLLKVRIEETAEEDLYHISFERYHETQSRFGSLDHLKKYM